MKLHNTLGTNCCSAYPAVLLPLISSEKGGYVDGKTTCHRSFCFIAAGDKVKDGETSTWKHLASFKMIIYYFQLEFTLKFKSSNLLRGVEKDDKFEMQNEY